MVPAYGGHSCATSRQPENSRRTYAQVGIRLSGEHVFGECLCFAFWFETFASSGSTLAQATPSARVRPFATVSDSPGMDDDGDLGFLAALAGAGDGAEGRGGCQGHAGEGSPDDPGGQGAHVGQSESEEDPEIQDLQALVELGRPQQRVYAQRSWQLLEKARAAKALKRSQEALAETGSKSRRLEAIVSVAAAEFPLVAAAVGMQPVRQGMTAERALVQMKLAMIPLLRGDAQHSKAQSRSVGAVAACIREAQEEFFRRVLGPSAPVDDALEPQDGQAGSEVFEVVALDWQWDETSQRVRALPTKLFKGERVSHARVSNQVMVQTGMVRAYEKMVTLYTWLQLNLTSYDHSSSRTKRPPFSFPASCAVCLWTSSMSAK